MTSLKLFDVQKAALRASNRAPGFAYFMEQGLGKTLTSYADFLDLVSDRLATRMIVVCPNSFKSGWVEDAEKHGVDLDFFVWQAGNEKYLESWIRRGFKKPPCLILNWEAIRGIKRKVGKRIFHEMNDLCTLIVEQYIAPVKGRVEIFWDESIHAKSHDSGNTIGGILLQKEVAYCRDLSGKPITQGPHDLWGQMRLIKQLNGKDYYAFKTMFCKMGGFKNKQVVGAQNEEFLTQMIEPHVFRATKKDWTDLPPKLYTIREYKMTAEMQSMYNSMYNDFVLFLRNEDNEVVTVDAAITKYIKLAQIQCGWVYKEDGTYHQLVEDAKNPRLNLLKEVLETEVVGKTAIPYRHKPVFDQLLRNLGGENKCAWIKGGMTPQETSEQKRRFNEDPNVDHILLQTTAAKYGHTLLGIQGTDRRCSTLIPYENTYSLDDRSQIEDRIHRHGQTADSALYLDLVGTPLDKDCIKALQRKEDVFQAVFAPIGKRYS